MSSYGGDKSLHTLKEIRPMHAPVTLSVKNNILHNTAIKKTPLSRSRMRIKAVSQPKNLRHTSLDQGQKKLAIPANNDSEELNDLHLMRAMRNSSLNHNDIFKLSDEGKSIRSS